MKKLLSIMLIAAVGLLWTANQTQAQNFDGRTIVEVKSTDVNPSNTRAVNPNIKIKAPTNDNNPLPASAKKGSKNPNQKDCEIIFDNYTGYFVEVYIDGVYKGTIGDWGTLYVTIPGGYTQVYCISTGGSKEWKVEGNCEGNYLWKLQ